MATQQQTSLESPAADRPETAVGSDHVWVELGIDRMANEACPVSEYGEKNVNGWVQMVGKQCHATLTVEGSQGTSRTVVSGEITDACACSRVCEPGMTPTEIRVESGSLAITAMADSRERLYDVADHLRESEDDWQLRRLTTDGNGEHFDAERGDRLAEEISLTDKQQEVVEAAVCRGYYANPREASLSDLAAELGVTRSALSQRLNAVEAKLIKTLAAEL